MPTWKMGMDEMNSLGIQPSTNELSADRPP